MCIADVFAMPSVTNAETFGLVQLEAMAAAKRVFDPASLFNPGKVLPDVEGEGTTKSEKILAMGE